MPVYERGGKSLGQLFELCKAHKEKNELVGRPTFMEIATAMTKKGETLSGLSTYFVRLRHSTEVFNSMMERLKTIVAEESFFFEHAVIEKLSITLTK